MGFIHDRLSMSGRVAVVTGGGRNLGRGMALGLADAGGAVVVAEIDEETGPAMERELLDAGHEALWLRTNVRDSASIDALVDGTVERFGRIDVMVANAGGMFMAPALDISRNGFEAVLDLNLNRCLALRERRGEGDDRRRPRRQHRHRLLDERDRRGAVRGALRRGEGRASSAHSDRWRPSGAEHEIRVNAIAPGVPPPPRE